MDDNIISWLDVKLRILNQDWITSLKSRKQDKFLTIHCRVFIPFENLEVYDKLEEIKYLVRMIKRFAGWMINLER